MTGLSFFGYRHERHPEEHMGHQYRRRVAYESDLFESVDTYHAHSRGLARDGDRHSGEEMWSFLKDIISLVRSYTHRHDGRGETSDAESELLVGVRKGCALICGIFRCSE